MVKAHDQTSVRKVNIAIIESNVSIMLYLLAIVDNFDV